MNPLPQTTIDRIEQDSVTKAKAVIDKFRADAPKNRKIDFLDGFSDGYEEGAKEWATRALPLYEALKSSFEELYKIKLIYPVFIKKELLDDLRNIIDSYDAGEAPEPGKEAKEFAEWLDVQRNNGTDYYKDMKIWGKEDAFVRMYELWQQSKNEQP